MSRERSAGGPSQATPQLLRLRVGSELDGHRADDGVLRSFAGFTRSEVKQLFEAGRVRADGKRLKKGDRLVSGSELTLEAPDVPIVADASLPLELVFESEDFVVANKLAGLPTAPL